MLYSDRQERVQLLGTPLNLEDLLTVLLLRAQVNALVLLWVLLGQIEQVDAMVIAHICS